MDRERSLYRPPRNALCSTVVVRLRFSGGLELVPSHTRNTRVALSPFVPYRRSTVLFVAQDFTPISGIVVRRSFQLAPTTATVFRIFTRIYIEYLCYPSNFFDGRIFARRWFRSNANRTGTRRDIIASTSGRVTIRLSSIRYLCKLSAKWESN